MSPGAPPQQSLHSDLQIPFVIHLYFLHRYTTDGQGRVRELWKESDAFEIWKNEEMALVAPYNSKIRPNGPADYCKGAGCSKFIAKGTIDWEKLEWQFVEPVNSENCRQISSQLVTAEYLRYFRELNILGPAREILRQAGLST